MTPPLWFCQKYRGKEVRIGNLFSPWEQFYCEIGGVLPCREGVEKRVIWRLLPYIFWRNHRGGVTVCYIGAILLLLSVK